MWSPIMPDPEKMTRLKEKAITSLLKFPTLAKAARAAGVNVRTLRRWLNDPAFEKAYRAARMRLVGDTVAALQRSGREAVDTLRRNLKRGPIPARTKAAVAVLAHMFRGTEAVDVIARLDELERTLKGVAALTPTASTADSLGHNGRPKTSPPTRTVSSTD
jgi:hypothetical protein